MKIIYAKGGEKILIDDCDYPLLSQFNWRVSNEHGHKYAIFSNNKMHRVIMGVVKTPEILVDHRDGNGLNNTRSNLRKCTNNQNIMNQQIRSNNTSGYKGVYFQKKYRTYCSNIMSNGKKYHIGSFKTLIEAAIAYNKYATELHGEFARLNVIK